MLPARFGTVSAPTTTDPELEHVAWDLSHLLDGNADDPAAAVDAVLAEAQQEADAFAALLAGAVVVAKIRRERG